jgi:hypothetical protein
LKPYYTDNSSEQFHIEALVSLRLRDAVGGLGKLWGLDHAWLVSLQILSPTIGPRLPFVWNTLKQSLVLDPSEKLGLRTLGVSDNWR